MGATEGKDHFACARPPAGGGCQFRILVVDDEKEMCDSLCRILQVKGYGADYSTDPLRVLPLLEDREYDLLLLDIRMPKKGGINLLRDLKARMPDVPVIMITAYTSFENALLAMKYGARNVYPKPIDIDLLLAEVGRLAARCRSPVSDTTPELHFTSDTMRRVVESARKAAASEVPVLIVGETGTGKELLADFLHRGSSRAARAITRLNCAAIPDSLLESELFGYERGAFTGAEATSRGKFEISDGSSLFLDEIADMSLGSQAKILRVLQEGTFNRVGGTRPLQIDVRIISATNRDIPQLMRSGGFREDLYYRLSVITIVIPPLRDRKEDIPHLSHTFVSEFNVKYGKSIAGISPEVMDFFLQHNWPGNVRELKNCIERAVIYCDSLSICLESLPSQYECAYGAMPHSSLAEQTSRATKEVILGALFRTDGNRQKAAELLQIDRKTLYNNMKKLGLA